ncbi:hypothetical protein LMC05_10195 [Limosilactobacillus reuteri]|uniref:hypothetical protein n=1 Tax=Limosilactobacillus reuteri TaxID=1598 RepID=UPI001E2F0E9C|nr:hypothetical protein [Limosilactobacillus reuteri]MCC4509319.1 hypothetical protein [Limosilactobacillus reuteri]MCC4509362.1 hypothetical protein [Limosilactobacillus reuteri]
MTERLSERFVTHMVRMYKDSLIAENAAIHDLGHANDNYEQRRFVLEMLLDGVDDIDQASDIRMWFDQLRYDIQKHTYTREYNEHGQIIYRLID